MGRAGAQAQRRRAGREESTNEEVAGQPTDQSMETVYGLRIPLQTPPGSTCLRSTGRTASCWRGRWADADADADAAAATGAAPAAAAVNDAPCPSAAIAAAAAADDDDDDAPSVSTAPLVCRCGGRRPMSCQFPGSRRRHGPARGSATGRPHTELRPYLPFNCAPLQTNPLPCSGTTTTAPPSSPATCRCTNAGVAMVSGTEAVHGDWGCG